VAPERVGGIALPGVMCAVGLEGRTPVVGDMTQGASRPRDGLFAAGAAAGFVVTAVIAVALGSAGELPRHKSTSTLSPSS
jgi:hypothetical protein